MERKREEEDRVEQQNRMRILMGKMMLKRTRKLAKSISSKLRMRIEEEDEEE